MLDVRRRESVSSAAAGWSGVDKHKADCFVKVKCEDCVLLPAFLFDNSPIHRNEVIGCLRDFVWLFNIVFVLNDFVQVCHREVLGGPCVVQFAELPSNTGFTR